MAAMNHGGAKVHAVVWRSAGNETPADLASALARQDIAWEEAVGPFDALARLLANRDAGHRGLVLLLVEPAQLRETDEVRAAIERFNPAIVSWVYRSKQSPHLAPLAQSSKATVPTEPEIVVRPSAPSRPETRSKPNLKLAGNGNKAGTKHEKHRDSTPGRPDLETPSEPERPTDPESPRSVLTPEELEMLLTDDRE